MIFYSEFLVAAALRPAPARRSFRLKDAREVDYVFSDQPETESTPHGGSGSGGEATGQEPHSHLENEKAELEEAGRCIVTRELERVRYAVEQMPADNPGFDLRCIRRD